MSTYKLFFGTSCTVQLIFTAGVQIFGSLLNCRIKCLHKNLILCYLIFVADNNNALTIASLWAPVIAVSLSIFFYAYAILEDFWIYAV